jgi:hypothetical protein
MQLIEFSAQVGTRDAFAIRARDLDSNFRKLRPQTNGTYGINETGDGWSLNIFPVFPEESTVAQALTLQEGALAWTAFSTSTISPGGEGSLYVTVSGSAQWSQSPPSGTPAWMQVERCDGKTMYVWGTEWV